MRLVKSFKSSLTRQVSEAVRMKRWGEEVVLNSKSEFNRCILGRLTIGEEEKSIISSKGEKNHAALSDTDKEGVEEDETEKSTKLWERKKTDQKRIQEVKSMIDLERGISRTPQRKRESNEEEQSCKKRGRKLKYELLSDTWGEEESMNKDDQAKSKDDLWVKKYKEGVVLDRPGASGEVNSPPIPVQKEDDQKTSLTNKEEVPDTPQEGLRKEEAQPEACNSPSRGKNDITENLLSRMNRQTSLDSFITSVRGKILTDTQTVKTSGRPETPRQESKKDVRKKESGRKRKTETPSSGNLLKYMKVKTNVSKDNGADIDNGGGRVVTPIPVSTSRQGIDIGVSQECEDVEKSGEPCDTNSVKTTFTAVECGTKDGDETVDNGTDDVTCVLGGGRCVTHKMKLVRSVTKKKMSCVNKLGQIAWKYRDVTSMKCPSRVIMNGSKAKTCNSDVKGK